ncbi:SDR family oxidoreductase [Curtobacterium sp. Leaf261]|uniref:SDR family oxidoreductase n=1 Tax=Curtobacterium sp. Leaf261 TaxID=1736311 RepID=UPI0006F72CC1|nr:SDR family oxidoreductase [Curtobacterium sp. Leaf261]KQO63789.1 NAD(P)-dependent oxidoreductase [Curtobacterium sp. Leaf261]
MTIALTGATGALGRLVVDALIARGTTPSDIVAVVRDTTKAQPVADLGVTVREAAYGDVPALTAAFQGVERLLLVSGSEVGQRVDQHRSVIDAAAAAGVGFIAYTSAPRADDTTLVLAPEHKATEELLAASGIPTALLRNNWYTENYVGQLEQAAATHELLTSAGDGRVASASRADYADAAAVVLTTDGHDGRVYELGGDVAWTFEDLAATFTDVLGEPVALVSVDTAEHARRLEAAGLDAGTVGFVTALDGNIAEGTLAEVTHDLSTLTGRPTTPLYDGLRAAR